jgi:predicted rRNA methylase YqxC with S4 and FtsJ domains
MNKITNTLSNQAMPIDDCLDMIKTLYKEFYKQVKGLIKDGKLNEKEIRKLKVMLGNIKYIVNNIKANSICLQRERNKIQLINEKSYENHY